jgi:hypothetical protein
LNSSSGLPFQKFRQSTQLSLTYSSGEKGIDSTFFVTEMPLEENQYKSIQQRPPSPQISFPPNNLYKKNKNNPVSPYVSPKNTESNPFNEEINSVYSTDSFVFNTLNPFDSSFGLSTIYSEGNLRSAEKNSDYDKG